MFFKMTFSNIVQELDKSITKVRSETIIDDDIQIAIKTNQILDDTSNRGKDERITKCLDTKLRNNKSGSILIKMGFLYLV